MEIRFLDPNDLEGYVTCVRASGLSTTEEQMRFTLALPMVRAYVAKEGSEIVGTGMVAGYGASGWIGLITVKPESQRRGLGTELTRWGIDLLRGQGVQSIFLAATEQGRPVYERMGFQSGGSLIIMTGSGRDYPLWDNRIRPVSSVDRAALRALDRSAAGEDRTELLDALRTTYITIGRDGRLSGYHGTLPWGGAVIAADPESGRLLFDLARSLRLNQPMRFVLPESNGAAVQYLTESGFALARRNTHMALGPWPESYDPMKIWGMFSYALG